jgi:hypothetical protein
MPISAQEELVNYPIRREWCGKGCGSRDFFMLTKNLRKKKEIVQIEQKILDGWARF